MTHFVAGVGTGGTISGVAKLSQGAEPGGPSSSAPTPKDASTPPISMHTYKVEGVGEDFWPGTFDPTLVDAWVKVSDSDSFLAARRVTREEGILIGGRAVWPPRRRLKWRARSTIRTRWSSCSSRQRPRLPLENLQRRLDAGKRLPLPLQWADSPRSAD